MSTAVVPFRQDQRPESEAPPHNIEVEQALLGALMVWPGALEKVVATLQAEHFFFADHQEIFTVITRLAAAGAAPTAPAVKGYLPKAEIDGQPAMAYLAHLGTSAAVSASVPGYAAIVMDFAQRRRLVAIGEELALRARHDPIDENGMVGAGLIDDAETQMLAVRAESPDAHLAGMTAGEGAEWMLSRIDELRSGTILSNAISTGVPDLDRATSGGFQRGQLYLMAGRPGMGKTVVMTSLSRYAAREAGVLVFQLEVTRDQQFARYLADLSYVHNRPLTFGQIMKGVDLSDEDVWRLRDAQKRLQQLHLKVECEPSISLAQLAYKVKAEKKRLAAQGVRLGVVFIDYLKYIKVSDRYLGQRVLEIGQIAGELKQLAKREDICVVLLAQLNRGVEAKERQDRRPTAADLRDSGELEEAADTILLLYRDAFYLQKKLRGGGDPEIAAKLFEKQNSLEIILGKNRSGPECTLDLWCDVASSTIAQHARGAV
ncbi:helicase DnaB [Methylorubrum extorquens]|uniref:replicative DNA helicase n=1 Tax=Methylorubrum extorquens TaxID=408 RepID=UPI00223894E3|nr:DnaB-like helicase C-terminal domain-containing protein [Methylorubrum extorquens]UYW25704.1 helicase DnaB [Methylorubrum extorquens]